MPCLTPRRSKQGKKIWRSSGPMYWIIPVRSTAGHKCIQVDTYDSDVIGGGSIMLKPLEERGRRNEALQKGGSNIRMCACNAI
ncbi:hypothetical protein HNY73_012996 [Argiope bruennichi]|uniref:Uncharacterized protein n=1 Tax=Argiope bruennichi TaxID=94029 RepID=A0A8T0EYC2_ARGBR|nr:hypothetical protein HNY73_012996 [Argiope bruennichi]